MIIINVPLTRVILKRDVLLPPLFALKKIVLTRNAMLITDVFTLKLSVMTEINVLPISVTPIMEYAFILPFVVMIMILVLMIGANTVLVIT
jgi:hypothetical protein